ncbi:MAG: ABC transporter ATP-binding protein [Polyangiaceae bacterium]|nr:ABC transporter ATP-binding protein [Polyangiaceae bacterium]
MTDPRGGGLPALSAPTIRVRHLWHFYGAREVLRDVSFDVGPGEIFGFIGPNGAGKTTTIRIMATLLEPLAGRVEVDRHDVAIDPDKVRRVIGYMPDHAGVYEGLTVREYLEFFADAFTVQNIGVVDAVIELTELTNLQDRLVPALSKGMKQRLQLARILLHDPKVLILDEPASDLDPRARIEMRDLLLELRELGKTIFLSSHILTELSDVCTSVGILERGRLLVAGPIREIAAELDARTRAAVTEAVPPPMAALGQTTPDTPADSRLEPAPAPLPTAPFPVPDGQAPPLVFGGGGFTAPTTTTGGASIPAATRKRLKLRVLGTSEPVVPLLAGGGGVLSVEAAPNGHLSLEYVGDDRFVAEVVRHLVAHGVGVVAVEPERNELERIFLEITRGELQ